MYFDTSSNLFYYYDKLLIKLTISRIKSYFNFNKLFSSSSLRNSFFNFSFSLNVPPAFPDSEIIFFKIRIVINVGDESIIF